MPLSEHEQRMLDQIESALYAEDPKFASHVRGGRLRGVAGRRRLQSLVLFILGLTLLVLGVAIPSLQVSGFPALSVLGFIVMFCTAAYLITAGGKMGEGSSAKAGSRLKDDADSSRGAGREQRTVKKNKQEGGFSARMEERFRKRFDNDL
ncbi:MAG: DUF3040 domain-containing protein [Mycobacteriaceae bacterium]